VRVGPLRFEVSGHRPVRVNLSLVWPRMGLGLAHPLQKLFGPGVWLRSEATLKSCPSASLTAFVIQVGAQQL